MPSSRERIAHQQRYEPPRPIRIASLCPGIDHLASGQPQETMVNFVFQMNCKLLTSFDFSATPSVIRLNLASCCYSLARFSKRIVEPWLKPLGPYIIITVWFQNFSDGFIQTFQCSLKLLIRYQSQLVFTVGG